MKHTQSMQDALNKLKAEFPGIVDTTNFDVECWVNGSLLVGSYDYRGHKVSFYNDHTVVETWPNRWGEQDVVDRFDSLGHALEWLADNIKDAA